MRLTARSKSGLFKQLSEFYKQLHAEGYDRTADKVYELAQDTLFDSFLTTQQIHNKFFNIMSSSTEFDRGTENDYLE